MPSILENIDGSIPPPPTAVHNAPLLAPRRALLKSSSSEQVRVVTIHPIAGGPRSIPADLISFLHGEFSDEIARGCTYPMEEAMERDQFAEYWFGTFAAVAMLDSNSDIDDDDDNGREGGLLREGRNWAEECLGTFYVKPNYPGRCSHVCNAGFLTTAAARGKGVGSIMGEAYLDYAAKLGYKYSVFNLVFANNPASIRIWEKLGFSVIGRVPGAARLANSEELVDALIIGRELGK